MDKITFTEKEVENLTDFVKRGWKSARELTRARILLLIHDGKMEMVIKKYCVSAGRPFPTSRRDIVKRAFKLLFQRNPGLASQENILINKKPRSLRWRVQTRQKAVKDGPFDSLTAE